VARTVIYSPKIKRSQAPHSHAVKVGNLVFVSGVPAYYGDLQMVKGDFPAQMRQCMQNLKDILEEAGSSIDKIAKVNIYVDRQGNIDEMNQIYREFFGNDPMQWPARTTVEARLPRREFLLEIDCVAEV